MKLSTPSCPSTPETSPKRRPQGIAGTKTAAALLATMLLIASGATPATASDESPTVQNDHAMGSTIPGHESAGHLFSLQATESASSLPGVPGMDVSSHQGVVNWTKAAENGARFAYVKASEGTEYSNPYFADQYAGAASVGMLRGAYHFALPNASSGAAQASYFLQSGAAWTPDGETLPALLDLEYNPYGSSCYGMTPGQMVSWISDFSTTILSRTGRLPAIYTTTDWWNTCTGRANGFGNHPLHIARWSATPGELPAGWQAYTLWQHADSGVFPGDQNVFNGTVQQLAAFASNPGPIFSDITGGQFTTEVNWLGSRGISTGWTEANGARTYRPLAPVARDAMAAFLYRLEGSPEFTAPAKSPFADVATTNPFYKQITWLASKGISTGWVEANGTKTYRPLEPVARDAMAAFMYRLAGSPEFNAPAESPFADVDTTNPFYKQITWLASSGISSGWNETNGTKTYRPFEPVARDAMAAFMSRFDTKFGDQ
ncbi:lysozyme [Arthrobacter sp. TS-15]|uniref:lysozyme n=1 Tax=Arthrobacter sp. TS-15 TaxID=2510797 RepID=UPI00115DC5CC|nr:GH25 family lysozyme [Arthrobacter sp. TS-15]TQS93675.1 lysozyme [Arthrobacter sp. TS-15]